MDPFHIDVPAIVNQDKSPYNSAVWAQDLVWKTYRELWMKGMDGERYSGKSVLPAWLDDDDDDYR